MVELLYRMLSLELERWPREEKQLVYIAASKIYDMLHPMYKSTFQYIYIPFLNSYIVWVLYSGLIVFIYGIVYQINMVLLEESSLQ